MVSFQHLPRFLLFWLQRADLFNHTLDCGDHRSFVVLYDSNSCSIYWAADGYQTILPSWKDHMTCTVGDKKKSSKATTGWNITFYFQNSNAQMSLEIQEQVLPVSIFTEQSDVAELYYHTLIPAKQIKCKYTTFSSPLSPLAEYWMAEIATWWGCSFISISVEASRKILTVPSLYPPATYVLSALEKGLQHTQSQAWWRHETNAWAAY